VNLQSRILAALFHRTVPARVLYEELRPTPREAIDAAIQGLKKDGRIVALCGSFARTDAEGLPRPALTLSSIPGVAARRKRRRAQMRLGEPLTDREQQVAEIAIEGKTSVEIGVLLGIRRRSVDEHLSNVYAKLGVEGRGELAGKMGVAAGEAA
jgi:DNA-binding CsgD family transcriptional regulator